MARTLSLVLAMSAMALAACGGDDEDPTSAFIADADAICIENGEESAEHALARETIAPDPKAQAEEAQLAIDSAQGYLERLQELEPPDELAADWEEFLTLREETIQLNQERADALAEDDIEAATKAANEASEVDGQENEAAAAVGLEACAEQLPAADEEEVSALVEEIEVSDDTDRVCEEIVLDSYIEGAYENGVAGCEKFYANADQLAESVEIDDVQGTEGGTATVTFEDVGGRYDGEPSIASLVYDGGAWKVSNLSLLG